MHSYEDDIWEEVDLTPDEIGEYLSTLPDSALKELQYVIRWKTCSYYFVKSTTGKISHCFE